MDVHRRRHNVLGPTRRPRSRASRVLVPESDSSTREVALALLGQVVLTVLAALQLVSHDSLLSRLLGGFVVVLFVISTARVARLLVGRLRG